MWARPLSSENPLDVTSTMTDPSSITSGHNDVGNMLGFEANSQERILETSLLQKGGFTKVPGQDPWSERVALGS